MVAATWLRYTAAEREKGEMPTWAAGCGVCLKGDSMPTKPKKKPWKVLGLANI
jgi:hypothetical protein